MGCGIYYNQIREVERALSAMRRFGIAETAPAYKQLYAIRGKLLKQVGFKFPRITSLLAKLVGLSPGEVRLWHDLEAGWMVEARAGPGAPPIYRSVSDEIAMTILKGELTKELEATLMAPDDYLGE